MLTFDSAEHIYEWDGQPVPSVTQVLREWVKLANGRGYVHTVYGTFVDATAFEAAADFGNAIHTACKYILTMELDWDALDPALLPPLREFVRWMDDYKIRPLFVENPLYSTKHGYAGTPDIIGNLQGFKQLDITDIKTGLVNELVGPQTGGYEIAFRGQKNYRGGIVRHELILPRDGSPYKYNLLTNSNDGAFFLSRLFQYNFLKQ